MVEWIIGLCYLVSGGGPAFQPGNYEREPRGDDMRLKMAFVGTALGLFGYILLSVFSFYLLIIPGAWGIVALYSYIARNIRLQDGSTMAFTGTPVQFLKLLLAVISVPLVVGIVMGAAASSLQQNGQNPQQFMPFFFLLEIVIFAWSFYWGFQILKWGIKSLQFSWGGQLEFTGSIIGYIGWILLMYVSVFLIIAPFWVMNALFKWMAEKTKSSTGDRLIWVGSGWELLWRSIVAGLWGMFIVTIPWAYRWYLAWMVSMVEVERAGGAAPMAYAPAPAQPEFLGQAPEGNPGGGRYGGTPTAGPTSSGPAPAAGGDPGLWGPGT